MNEPTIPQTVLFADLVDRPLTATFDQPHASSDGGAILLTAADRRLGLLAALAATVPDARAAGRVTHGVGDLLAQRVFAIACGHPDGNDADRLADRSDPQTVAGTRSDRRRPLGLAADDLAVRAHGRPADAARDERGVRLITIDLDVTDDQTHGAQPLTFFNGFSDHW